MHVFCTRKIGIFSKDIFLLIPDPDLRHFATTYTQFSQNFEKFQTITDSNFSKIRPLREKKEIIFSFLKNFRSRSKISLRKEKEIIFSFFKNFRCRSKIASRKNYLLFLQKFRCISKILSEEKSIFLLITAKELAAFETESFR